MSPIPNQDKSFGKDGQRDLSELSRNRASNRSSPEQDSLPAWVSKWGLIAFVLATSGFLAASLIDVPWPTMLLEVLALAAVACGIKELRDGKDRAWLTVSGGLAGLVLLLALVFPGAINNRWALNRAVAPVDPAKQASVPRDKPKADGKEITAADWVNGETEGIRQDDLLATIEAADVESFGAKKASYGRIHCEFVNVGGGTLVFRGFNEDKHLPTLTDDSGRMFTYVGVHQRLPARDEPLFSQDAFTGELRLAPTKSQGFLLLFQAPPATFKNLKLELPGSAWGKPGAFRFILTHPF